MSPVPPRRPATRRAVHACATAALALAALQPWTTAHAQAAGGASAAPTARIAGSALGRDLRSGDWIVAVVNTELVTQVELQQRLERAEAELRRAGGSKPDEQTVRQQVLDSLIDERVLITYARELGAKVDEAELDRAVANIAAQNQLSVAQLRERLRADGMDEPRFRNNLRDQLLVERVREREVAARIRISDVEIDALIDEWKARAAAQAPINIAQILVSLPENASTAEQARAQARADAALARLRAGEAFERVARELSDDPKKDSGGALGLRTPDRLPDLFVDAVRTLQPGQFAPTVVRSGAGLHVLKLVERQDSAAFRVTQTRARHILLRVNEADQAEAVLRRMTDLRAQIDGGRRSFEAVAREVSEDGSAESGGDLGWTDPGTFVPEFEQAMDRLAAGTVSAPVRTRFGVHLIRVDERRDVTPEPKAVREQARNQLRERKYEQAYLDWVKELRLRAYVELRETPQ